MFWFDFAWDIQHFLNQFWWQINFLLLVTIVVLGYLAYKKPEYAVGLTIMLLPTYLFRSYTWFLPLTFLEIAIWVLFIGWSASLLKNKTHAKIPYKLPIILIFVASTIGMFLGPNLFSSAGLWKAYFIEPIMFFVVLVNVLQKDNAKQVILWALGISTLIISWLAIFQKFTAFGIYEPGWVAAESRRVTSIFSSPNAVGLYLGPIMAIYFGWLMAEIKNLQKTFLKLAIVVPALVAILFTVSQGTWLGLAAAVAFLAFFGWNKKYTAAIVAGLIVLILIIPITRDITSPFITFSDTAGQNRLELVQLGGQQLKNVKTFIFGAGILGFAEIQNVYRDPLKIEPLLYPHNIILNFWLEIGLLGLIAFGLIITKFFKTAKQKLLQEKNWLTLGVVAAMIVILVHGLIDVPYFKNDLAVLFWIILGLL